MTTSEKLKAYSAKTGIPLSYICRKELKLFGKVTIYPKIKANQWTELQKDIIESLYNKIQN